MGSSDVPASVSRPCRTRKPTRRPSPSPEASQPVRHPPKRPVKQVVQKDKEKDVLKALKHADSRVRVRVRKPARRSAKVATKSILPARFDAPAEDAPAPTPSPPQPCMYHALWSMVCRKESLLDKIRVFDVAAEPQLAVNEVTKWIDDSLAGRYQLVRTRVMAGYKGRAKDDWITGVLDDYPVLMDRLKAWHADGRKELTIKVIASVFDTTVTTNTMPARGIVAPRQGATATSRQLAALPLDLDTTTLLTQRWACKSKACPNYTGGLCFYAVRDDPTFHLPVYPSILTAWAKAIKAPLA